MIRGPKPVQGPKRCLYCDEIIEDPLRGRKRKFCNQQHSKAYWDEANRPHKLEYDRDYAAGRRKRVKDGR